MRVIKIDISKNHYRVVRRFAFLPKKIWPSESSTFKWIWWRKYYELQLDSYWGKGWLCEEQSFLPNTWDFKWSDEYLSLHNEDPKVKEKYPPNYKNTSIQ